VVVTVGGVQVPQPEYPAVVLILEYDCGSDPVLSTVPPNPTPSGWAPKEWPAGGGLYKALHVYATAETREIEDDNDHSREAFVKAAGLLGVKAEIRWSSPATYRSNVPPPGLAWQQVNLMLWQRLRFTQSLGQLINGWSFQTPMSVSGNGDGNKDAPIEVMPFVHTNNCGSVGDGSI
jgi:hypothetical protein